MEERTLTLLAIAILVTNAGFFVFTLTPAGESIAASHGHRAQSFDADCDAWQDAAGATCADATANATSTNASFAALNA